MADEKEEGELETVNTAEAIRKEIKELHKELAKINKEEEGNIIEEEEEPQWVSDGGYQRVKECRLYYHAETGCYYESISGQFLTPTPTQDSAHNTDEPAGKGEGTNAKTTPLGMTGDIASQLAAVSDHVTQSCGFVYDESSGLYYDHNTCLYYDQSNRLYYDAENGTYYSYDYSTKQYTIHSQIDLPQPDYDPSLDVCTIQSKAMNVNEPMNINERMIEEEKPTQLDLMFADEEDIIPDTPPPVSEWPPCIRLIPQQEKGGDNNRPHQHSSSSSNDVRNCISVVTAEGAIIGRDVTGPQSLRIADLQVSKYHAEIIYQKRKEMFIIKDLGSQNGTFLNDQRISEPKEPSKAFLLQHGDYLKVGNIQFLLHIHRGMASCSECSHLGVSVVGVADGCGSKESLETQRRKELNKIKKRHGLRVKDSYGEELHKLPDKYTDKAEERRRKIGSDLPLTAVRDDVPSSVDRPISESNVGHKMLKKYGWKEGQALGTADNTTAIKEPIQAVVRTEKTGLGYGDTPSYSMDEPLLGGASGKERHHKMLRRFQNVVEMDQKRRKI